MPFAAGNFLGPLLLGRLFDTLGRKRMITATYALAGVLMAAVGWLFAGDALSAFYAFGSQIMWGCLLGVEAERRSLETVAPPLSAA